MPFQLVPTRFKMEGMVDKANRVLEYTAKTDRTGATQELFRRAKGIIMISVVESAMIVSASVGIGVMMTKNEKTGKWSPPCACGTASSSWGVALGAAMKDMIIFAMDEQSVQAFTSRVGLKLGAGASITLGNLGTNAGANVNLSGSGANAHVNVHNIGAGSTVTIAYCTGAMASASFGGSVVGPRDMVNRSFYGNPKLSARDILFGDGEETVQIPEDKYAKIVEIYEKLDLLCQGETTEVNPEAFKEASGFIPPEVAMTLQNVVAETIENLDDEEKEPTGEPDESSNGDEMPNVEGMSLKA